MGLFDRALGQRVPDEVLELLRGVSTATAWSFLTQKGIRRPFMLGIRPVSSVFPLVGRARTLRYLPVREDLLPLLHEAGLGGTENPQRAAVESMEPGEVLVVDAMGDLEAGTLGDILATRVSMRGAAGIVVDGCVRDAPFIRRMDLPVFTRSVHPAASTSRLLPFEHNGAVQCGGVAVLPGDVLLGDEDGVLVVPAAYAAELAQWGPEHERQELFQRRKIEEGLPATRVYPMDAAVRDEYERWRVTQS